MADKKKQPIESQPKPAKQQMGSGAKPAAKPAVKHPEHKPAAKPGTGMQGKGK